MSSPPTATVLHALTQRPHRGPDTSAGDRAALSTQHALYTPRGGTGVEAVTDGLRGLRAQPQHGAPIQLLPPVPVPQRDNTLRLVLRWHSREPLLTWVTRANAVMILTIPRRPVSASAPSAGASACTTPPSTRSAGVSSGPGRGQGRAGGFSCMGHRGPSGTLACRAWPLPCALGAPSAVPTPHRQGAARVPRSAWCWGFLEEGCGLLRIAAQLAGESR